jgi:endoglucanase
MILLKELSDAVGVSGKEDAVRKIILTAIEGHAHDIHIDALGSVTALKHGTDAASRPRVMIATHMDEIGFMVTGFDGDGLIRFTSIGGIDERILPGLRLLVGDKALPGCVVWAPIHKNREQTIVKLENLRIDIGASSKDSAKGQVKPGDRIAFDSRYLTVGESVVRGKAFDNRVGCALLVNLLQDDSFPCDLLAAFTVQEEIGVRGAKVAAQTLRPDVALVLEATTANDIPDPNADPDDDHEPNPTCRLGAGPVLTVMDRSLIVPPKLLNFLRATAEADSIPYQLKTALGGGTDGGAIHTANSGVPTAVISAPCRYIHSPTAYLHRDDYAHMLRLVSAALRGLTWDVLA